VAIRGRRIPESSLSDRELVRLVRDYVPETIRKMCDAMRVPRLAPWSRPFPTDDGDRVSAGRHSLERYMSADEFWPMLEWAALQIARRIVLSIRGGEDIPAIAARFELPSSAIASRRVLDLCMKEPSALVPSLIRSLRGLDVTTRSLETYRARWSQDVDSSRRPPRDLRPGEAKPLRRPDQYQHLERKAAEFLKAKAPRASSRRPRRAVPAYPWLY
jgi:hypothetical protein